MLLFLLFNGGKRNLSRIGKWLVSHFALSKGYRRNPPMLVWWNNCTNRSFYYPHSYLATLGDQQVKIRRQLELTLVIVQIERWLFRYWSGFTRTSNAREEFMDNFLKIYLKSTVSCQDQGLLDLATSTQIYSDDTAFLGTAISKYLNKRKMGEVKAKGSVRSKYKHIMGGEKKIFARKGEGRISSL